MLSEFIHSYNANPTCEEHYLEIKTMLSRLLGKKIKWVSKHEASTNKELYVYIERLSNRFATVFRETPSGEVVRYTINYHNLICKDDEISYRA